MSKSKKSNIRSKSEYESFKALDQFRPSKWKANGSNDRLTINLLDAIFEDFLNDACEEVMRKEVPTQVFAGLRLNTQAAVFVSGPPEEAPTFNVTNDGVAFIASGPVTENLDLVAEMMQKLDLGALVATYPVRYALCAPELIDDTSPEDAVLPFEACYVEAICPTLGYRRTAVAPIVHTPYGRLVSADTYFGEDVFPIEANLQRLTPMLTRQPLAS